METIEDVLREMRDAANSPSAIEDNGGFLLSDDFYDGECQGWLSYYADRIEKAYKQMEKQNAQKRYSVRNRGVQEVRCGHPAEQTRNPYGLCVEKWNSTVQ